MSLYYAKSTGGFYDSAVHGARTLIQLDPSWVRPTIVVSATETSPEHEIRDESATPAVIVIQNPECKIPEDAVEISQETYQQLLIDQSNGKVIVADSKGKPKAAEPTPLSKEQLAAQAEACRSADYRKEADPLFFKYQRGEAKKEDWLAKVAEIKARYV